MDNSKLYAGLLKGQVIAGIGTDLYVLCEDGSVINNKGNQMMPPDEVRALIHAGFVAGGALTPYVLPRAGTTLGGIMADARTSSDSVEARIGTDGKLYVTPEAPSPLDAFCFEIKGLVGSAMPEGGYWCVLEDDIVTAVKKIVNDQYVDVEAYAAGTAIPDGHFWVDTVNELLKVASGEELVAYTGGTFSYGGVAPTGEAGDAWLDTSGSPTLNIHNGTEFVWEVNCVISATEPTIVGVGVVIYHYDENVNRITEVLEEEGALYTSGVYWGSFAEDAPTIIEYGDKVFGTVYDDVNETEVDGVGILTASEDGDYFSLVAPAATGKLYILPNGIYKYDSSTEKLVLV